MKRFITRYFSKAPRQSVIERFFLYEKQKNPYRDCWKFYDQKLLLTAKQIDVKYYLGTKLSDVIWIFETWI